MRVFAAAAKRNDSTSERGPAAAAFALVERFGAVSIL